jgi:glutathione S-transferase
VIPLTLVIGNKNYSSWSLRPWIAMKVAGIPFAEELIPLYEPGSRERVLAFSPAGKVPVLVDGTLHIWESLAIIEHLADAFPDAGLWPSETDARGHARTVAAEMHAGFAPLRRHLPMNMWRPVGRRELPPEVADNVRRIDTIWTDCRTRFSRGGAFLFGPFTGADAMYAPVVSRFATYGVEVGPQARAYMEAVMALPAWGEWHSAALQEPWVLPQNEVDWPAVPRQ